jgi:Mg-chelatase subunit ChlD
MSASIRSRIQNALTRPTLPKVAALAILLGATAIGASLAPAESSEEAARVVQPAARSRIEAVFVLDTTGSMGGLIDGAKQKIWTLASEMANAQNSPEIRMGLVAYRDRGDAYVTRRFDLSPDLDALYAELQDLVADGGGDGPESVNQALHEAVTQMSWTTDPNGYRVVFLVGDAPPHMDFEQDIPFPQSVSLAVQR